MGRVNLSPRETRLRLLLFVLLSLEIYVLPPGRIPHTLGGLDNCFFPMESAGMCPVGSPLSVCDTGILAAQQLALVFCDMLTIPLCTGLVVGGPVVLGGADSCCTSHC